MDASRQSNIVMNLAGASVCVASLLIAIFYMERVLHLAPCPLCILSRYVVCIMGIIFFLGLIDNQRFISQLVYTGINLVFVAFGIVIAGRHMWIQYHPFLACTIGPVSKSIIGYITKAFAERSECANNDWRFLGLTVPEQTLVLFIGLTILLCFQVYLNQKKGFPRTGHHGGPSLKLIKFLTTDPYGDQYKH